MSNFIDYLEAAELIYTRTRVSWNQASGMISWSQPLRVAPLFQHKNHLTYGDFIDWVTNAQYSAMLRDGSLLQITYVIQKGEVVSHRLAYIPCPIPVDSEIVAGMDLVEYLTDAPFNLTEFLMKSPIRFDYQSSAAGPDHAASHLTVNSVDCRIPCRTWMPLNQFAELVFRHFYPSIWNSHPFFAGMPSFSDVNSSERLLDDHRRHFHVNWL